MKIEELFRIKGQLTTEIEIAQAKLQQVNKQIIELINQREIEARKREVNESPVST